MLSADLLLLLMRAQEKLTISSAVKWPQDVIDHLYEINDLARQYPVVDLAGGMSTEIESLTTSNANKSVGLNAALHGVEWATTREELSGALDVLVAEVVDGLEKAQNE